MRILHFIWGLPKGGQEGLLVDVVNYQAQTDSVTILVGNRLVDRDVRAGLRPNVRVLECDRPPGSRNPWYVMKMMAEARSVRPDIVHCHDQHGIDALYLPRTPFVVTLHNTQKEVEFLHRFDRIFAVSDAVAEYVERAAPGLQPVVVKNGILFDKAPVRPSLPSSPFRIVNVARLSSPQKGQEVLLGAMAELVKHGHKDITVDFVGDGESRPMFERMASDLGIDHVVRFLGFLPRDQVQQNLSNYHLLVHSPLREAFGLVVVEAMRAGTPVLVSGIEGPLEVIGGGRHGYTFQSKDSVDCAKMILKVREEYGRPGFFSKLDDAYAYAHSSFSVEKTATEYLEQYRDVIARFALNGRPRQRATVLSEATVWGRLAEARKYLQH